MDKSHQPFIEVKKARIARAGTQFYHADEVKGWGFTPEKGKTVYAEYRPPEVLIRNLKKFNNVAFVNEHTPVDVTPQNWKQYAIGFVSGNAAVEVTDSGEIFVTNDVVFYDESAYEAYKAGKVELSASSRLSKAKVKDSAKAGYDFLVTDILSVNHVALCNRARAGRDARVLDSMDIAGRRFKEVRMFGDILEKLGLVKPKQDAAKLSDAVFAGVEKVGKVDDAALEAEIIAVLDRVKALGDGEDKDRLIAVVSDSFKHPAEVLSSKDKVAPVIDGLYGKCQEADKEAAQAILDSIGETDADKDKDKDKDKDDKEKKDTTNQDAVALIDAAVAKAISGAADSLRKEIPGVVDASIRKALGLEQSRYIPPTVGSTVNDADDVDVSDMFRDVWGRM
jgi:hypothetical protein